PNTRNRSKPLLFSLPFPHLQHAPATTTKKGKKLNPGASFQELGKERFVKKESQRKEEIKHTRHGSSRGK
ncbi:hypothetical protein VIGAN_09067200, partial [Vigna angularis var. angularis]